jgi:hypothetical protein
MYRPKALRGRVFVKREKSAAVALAARSGARFTVRRSYAQSAENRHFDPHDFAGLRQGIMSNLLGSTSPASPRGTTAGLPTGTRNPASPSSWHTTPPSAFNTSTATGGFSSPIHAQAMNPAKTGRARPTQPKQTAATVHANRSRFEPIESHRWHLRTQEPRGTYTDHLPHPK